MIWYASFIAETYSKRNFFVRTLLWVNGILWNGHCDFMQMKNHSARQPFTWITFHGIFDIWSIIPSNVLLPDDREKDLSTRGWPNFGTTFPDQPSNHGPVSRDFGLSMDIPSNIILPDDCEKNSSTRGRPNFGTTFPGQPSDNSPVSRDFGYIKAYSVQCLFAGWPRRGFINSWMTQLRHHFPRPALRLWSCFVGLNKIPAKPTFSVTRLGGRFFLNIL